MSAKGGRNGYRAVTAEAAVVVRAKRPKTSKVVDNPALRSVVEEKLAEFWSPEQIPGWLRIEHTAGESMWVSHIAIYLALYAKQLAAQPTQCLRTRRPLRRCRHRHRRKNQGQGRIRNPVMISERPARVEDRVEFGHWEGDLIIGNRSTALATLVETSNRYTILVPLPVAQTMDAPNLLAVSVGSRQRGPWPRRSRTGRWRHGLRVQPRQPWQRGSNENTKGLLLQWFPRSIDFYLLDRQVITAAQTSLNDRLPRTLDFRTPADVLATAC